MNLPLNQNLLLLFVFWYSGVLLICFMWDKVGRLIVSRNFSVKFYHYLIQKDCVTHMHHLAVFMKEGLSVTLNLPLEKLKDYYFFLAFCLFFPFHMTVTVIFSNIGDVWNNLSSNVFFFGDFDSVHHKDWLIYSGRFDKHKYFPIFFFQVKWPHRDC